MNNSYFVCVFEFHQQHILRVEGTTSPALVGDVYTKSGFVMERMIVRTTLTKKAVVWIQ